MSLHTHTPGDVQPSQASHNLSFENVQPPHTWLASQAS